MGTIAQIEGWEVVITGLETGALKLGGTIASHAAKSWLQRRRAKFEREASLAELAEVELKSPLQRRKLENLVEHIGFQVTEQLEPVLSQRFASLPDNEAEAAILAVADVLGQADLSNQALLADDADPEKLARRLRQQFPDRPEKVALAERAWPLYELALDQACRHLVQVVRHLPAFQANALAEALNRLSSQSEQLNEILARIPKTSLHVPRGIDYDAEFEAEYLRFLANTLDRLELLGLPTEEQPNLSLSVAYLSLSVSSEPPGARRERKLSLPRTEKWFETSEDYSENATVKVESAIGTGSRVLIRGEAGSGKTTLLDWLAVTAARREFTDQLRKWNRCVPFRIRLRGYTAAPLPTPKQFVEHSAGPIAGSMPVGWVEWRLQNGTAMLLVDGVDEVPERRRREVKEWLRALTTTFPNIRILVTSRTAAADHRWLAEEKFSSVTLEPMSPGNILTFVERWHDAAKAAGSTADVSAAQRRLRNQLERPHLRELAASPLLCAMLCALNLAHRSELPRNRMDLYAKALAMLLHLRDAERGVPGLLSDAEKRVLLRHLAWHLTLADQIELPKTDALEHLTHKLQGMPNVDAEPATLLKHLLERSGVLREPVPERIDFVHRTFQEYLAADEAIQQHHIATLVAHAHLDTWWETIVMACGHATAKQAGKLIIRLLDRADTAKSNARHLRLLAAACLETVQDVDPRVTQRVDTVIQERLVPPATMQETHSLAAIGHRLLRYLPNRLDDLPDRTAAATVRAAALTGQDDSLPLLSRYAQDQRWKVQHQLTLASHYYDPERFVDEVLAESPLHNGEFEVRSTRLLPYASRMKRLNSLRIFCPHIEPQSDLRFLRGVPSVTWIETGFDSTYVDLTPLTEHKAVRSLELYGASEYTSLETLSQLPELRDLTLLRQASWKSLRFLSDLPGLVALRLDSLSEIRSIEALAALTGLRVLELFQTGSKTLISSSSLTTIRTLRIDEHVGELPASRIASTFPNLTQLSLTRMEAHVELAAFRDLPLRVLRLARMPAWMSLRPLAKRNLKLILDRNAFYTGLDELGPDVEITYQG